MHQNSLNSNPNLYRTRDRNTKPSPHHFNLLAWIGRTNWEKFILHNLLTTTQNERRRANLFHFAPSRTSPPKLRYWNGLTPICNLVEQRCIHNRIATAYKCVHALPTALIRKIIYLVISFHCCCYYLSSAVVNTVKRLELLCPRRKSNLSWNKTREKNTDAWKSFPHMYCYAVIYFITHTEKW